MSEVTNLTPSQERMFRAWAQASNITDVDHPDSHYDYRGLFLDAKGVPVPQTVNRHFPDTWKQHGHPTFSTESRYSRGPNDRGSWSGDRYVPQATAKRSIAYATARQLIDSGQASAEDIVANFTLVMPAGPSVADQARASIERRKQGGDLPPGYTDEMMRDHQTPQQARYGMLAPFVAENAPGFVRGAKEMLPSMHDAGTLARAGAEMLAPASTPLLEKVTGHERELPASAQVLKNIGSAQVNEGKQAVGEMRNAINAPSVPEYLKRSVEAAGHGAAALLPVIGPAAASAGEDIKRGDIAYGLGKGSALVASVALPAAAGDAVKAMSPTFKVTRVASFADNLQRIAAASPDAPTLTGVLKNAAHNVGNSLIAGTIGHAMPSGGTLATAAKYLLEVGGDGRAVISTIKALKDLPRTAAWKAASVTAKLNFTKALSSGDIEAAVHAGGDIVGGAGVVNGVPPE